jgi:hypothetical protein
MAIQLAETMEAGNRILPPGLEGYEIDYAGAYTTIQHSLALKLSLDVARIFDVTEDRELDKQDKASIQVLIHHLKKSAVEAELVAKAQTWPPLPRDITLPPAQVCKGAVHLAVGKSSKLMAGDVVEALSRVRQLRTRRLAHMLFDKEPDPLPRYGDLFLLLNLARDIATPAVLAVEGRVTVFDGNEQFARRDAEQFWEKVLQGLRGY